MLIKRTFSKDFYKHLLETKYPDNAGGSVELSLPRPLKVILLVILLFLFYQTIIKREFTILAGVDLLFHEAGHLVFILFGEFISILGGTLMQLLIPAIVLINFILRQEVFASSVAVFWLGESLAGVAIYIRDANFLELNLIGGGMHDWIYLLGKLGLLSHAVLIGDIVFFMSSLIMLGAIIIGAWSIKRKMV